MPGKAQKSLPAFAATDVPIPRVKPAVPASGPTAKPNAAPSNSVRSAASEEIKPTQVRPVYDAEQFDQSVHALLERNVDFDELPAQVAKPPCGVTRPLRVTELSNRVKVAGKPTLNCATVLALDKWVTSGVQAAASTHFEKEIEAINISTSHQCRRRNNSGKGKFSEHAFGNGIDVMSFTTVDGALHPVQSHANGEAAAAKFQAKSRSSACEYFTTVLGSGSNDAHANHCHLDLAIRRGGYRLCE